MRTSALRKMTTPLTMIALAIAGATAAFAQAPTVAAAQVPPAVLKAFQQTYPGAAISAAAPARDRDRAVFRIESVDKGRRRVVLYDTAGTAFEVAEYLEEKELPRPVAAAMHSHPRAIFVSGIKVARGSDVEYRLTLRGTRKTAMVARPDGTVVSFK
jgi:hypothetical protein